MTKIEAVGLISQPSFRSLVAYYLMQAAGNIINENPTTPNHAERVVLAKEVQEDPEVYVTRFGWRCVLNATIQSRADLAAVLANEGDIEFVINSNWDYFI